MRLGIEARWLARGPESGRTVVAGLLNGLLKIVGGSEHSLVLFVDHRDVVAIQSHLPVLREVSIKGIRFWTRRFTVERQLGALADSERVDVLLTQAFTPLRCRARRVVYGLDILFESHRQFFTRLEHLYFRGIRSGCTRADRIIAISNFTKTQLVDYGYANPEKVAVVYCGAQATRLIARPRSELPERYFLYVGRLNDRKNIGTILEAFRNVFEDVNAHLVIAGAPSGKFTHFDVHLISALRDRVHFLGHVPDDLLPDLYSHALALVYIPFAEGFGLPVIEAMSYGLPAIVSTGSGVAEAAGGAGYAVDPHSPDQVARAMKLLASDPEMRSRLSDEATHQAAHFTWDAAARRVWELCCETHRRSH